MYMVYWTVFEAQEKLACSKEFTSDQLKETLQFMEALRKQQREDGSIGFVTFSSEDPNSVGHPGVDETGDDYDWKKRRP